MGFSGCAATAPSSPLCARLPFSGPPDPLGSKAPLCCAFAASPAPSRLLLSFQPPHRPGSRGSFSCAVAASFRPLPSSPIQGGVLPPILCHPSPFPVIFLDCLSVKQANTKRTNSLVVHQAFLEQANSANLVQALVHTGRVAAAGLGHNGARIPLLAVSESSILQRLAPPRGSLASPSRGPFLPFQPSLSPKFPPQSLQLQMAPNGSKWLQLAPNGSKLPNMAPNGSKWTQIDPNATKWLQVAPGCFKWLQMASNGSKWLQKSPNCSK